MARVLTKRATVQGRRSASARPWGEWVERFLDQLVLARGRATNTLLAYRRDLARYEAFCAKREIAHPREIDSRLIGNFVAELTGLGLSPASVARSLSAVKTFHRYLVQNDVCSVNPARSLRTPRLPRRLPHVLSVRQVRRLLGAPPAGEPLGIRDRAILAILYGCGLRVSEAAGLMLDDVDFDALFVRVRGKGDRERLVPFGDMTRGALEAYLDGPRFVGDRTDDAGRVFLGRRRNGLTRMGLWQIVRRAALRVDLADEVTPHTLRHSFATHLVEAGADLLAVQMMLGHSSVVTTQIYTHLDKGHLSSVHRSCHPLEAGWEPASGGGK